MVQLIFKNLCALKGVEETQRYIVNEISRIFATQGQLISDKHLEIVIRQMFSRVQVEDAGDSQFVVATLPRAPQSLKKTLV